MAKVPVPEKTLEHWSNQYLTYRYRSKAAMWWPATGVDINAQWLPHCPGKAVQLELKTTVVAGVNYQDVMVNLGQLWDYDHLPSAHKPFYFFPWLDWRGDLEAVAAAARIPASELAFSRSGAGWWFADWMAVLTTAQVATVLATELAAHGSSIRSGASCRLVRFDLSPATPSLARTWGVGVAEPTCTPWRQFWTDLEMCGHDGWPQLIRLPANTVTRPDYRRAEIAAMLDEVRICIRAPTPRRLTVHRRPTRVNVFGQRRSAMPKLIGHQARPTTPTVFDLRPDVARKLRAATQVIT